MEEYLTCFFAQHRRINFEREKGTTAAISFMLIFFGHVSVRVLKSRLNNKTSKNQTSKNQTNKKQHTSAFIDDRTGLCAGSPREERPKTNVSEVTKPPLDPFFSDKDIRYVVAFRIFRAELDANCLCAAISGGGGGGDSG